MVDFRCEDEPPAEVSSLEDLETLLQRGGVPRGLRRRVVRDAAGFQRRLIDVDGALPGSIRFRVLCCRDCGALEVTTGGDFGPRVCH